VRCFSAGGRGHLLSELDQQCDIGLRAWKLTSRQRSFSWGHSAMTGRKEDAAWRM
jgi:hypothetical protein